MAQAYYPIDKLVEILPEDMALPSFARMKEYFPDTELIEGQHPIMLSFCHGSGIHDVFTGSNVPEQEELMFVFPVNVRGRMCSYVPVLYLNSTIGTLGGLYFGLRKQYHPEMRVSVEKDEDLWVKRWEILTVIDARFRMPNPNANNEVKKKSDLPQFIDRIFNQQPFVTRSYFGNTLFYRAQVYPLKGSVINSEEKFSWRYKGANLRDSKKTWSVHSRYWFTMSRPMDYEHYFDDEALEAAVTVLPDVVIA